MAYRTDGSSHETGIASEDSLKTQLENGLARALYPNLGADFQVVKKGGTTHKQDLEVICSRKTRLISAKKKVEMETGSFDWVNTSHAPKSHDVFESLIESTKKLKHSKLSVSEVREKFNQASHNTMRRLSGETLKTILIDHVNEKNEDMKIVITESSSNTHYAYDFVDSPLYAAIRDYTPQFDWGRGKTSARILFYDSAGNQYDYGLRGRLVLNNGVRALLGQSSSNKSSQVVFKVQQDKVHKMIENITNIKTIKGNQ